jgi:hypothetical protein
MDLINSTPGLANLLISPSHQPSSSTTQTAQIISTSTVSYGHVDRISASTSSLHHVNKVFDKQFRCQTKVVFQG